MPREYRSLAELTRDVSQFLEAVTHPSEIVVDVGPDRMDFSGSMIEPEFYAVRHRGGVSITVRPNAIAVEREGGPFTSWRIECELGSIDGPVFRVDLARVLASALTEISDGRVHRLDDDDLSPVVWDGGRLPSGRALIEEVNARLEEWARLPGTVEPGDGMREGEPLTLRHGQRRTRDGQLETFDRGFDWVSPEREREIQDAIADGRPVITATQRPRGPRIEPTLIRNFEEFVEMYGRPDSETARIVERCFREGADRVTVDSERVTLPSGETVTFRPMTAEDAAQLEGGPDRAEILERLVRDAHRGPANAGRPQIIEPEATTEEIDLRPRRRSSQRETDSAFGRAVRKRLRETRDAKE